MTEETAVTEETAETTEAEETIKIGVIPIDPSVEFYTVMVEGYEDAAAELGVEITVQFSDNDIEAETRATETYIAQGYAGIVVNPIDSVAIAGPLQKALDAGLPMVLTDVAPEETEGATAIVTSDNYSGGYAAGEFMRELLNDEGEIIMTKYEFSSIAMDDRYDGFMDALEGSNITIVETIDQDGTREDTLSKITPLLTKYPDLKGIFCSQGDPAIGALAAVDAAGLSDDIIIVSYDVESEVAEAIKQGSAIKGGVTQFPYAMGVLGVRQLVKAINGEPYEELIELPVVTVTQDNIDLLMEDSVEFLKQYGDFDLYSDEWQ
ncbi:MAG: sugar ABC transporter substrate-binding protein [Eubacteriales bacterium]|nr:sugar ABC transporter substrate-binding protein [Eubacteriales bacterium]